MDSRGGLLGSWLMMGGERWALLGERLKDAEVRNFLAMR